MTDYQKQSLYDYLALGASLYIPTSRPDLISCVHSPEITALKSIILCLEDAVLESEREQSLHRFAELLKFGLPQTKVFVRPKNPNLLYKILQLDGIEQVYGFVLPKVSLENISQYTELLSQHKAFKLMPTLETKAVLLQTKLERLKLALEPLKESIICLRVGANDLFALLGIKRMPGQSIYNSPLRTALDQIILCFRSEGYYVSAPVYDFIEDMETLKSELKQDINYGLLSKTAIHPRQVAVIEAHYQVEQVELEQAQAILEEQAKAVFQFNAQMCEPSVHQAWAEQTLVRAEIYGIKP